MNRNFKDILGHPLVKNFSSLVLIQGMNYVFPWITFAYLTYALGVELIGHLSYAFAIANILLVFSDFGFNLTSPKNISIYRNNKERRDEIFNGVLLLKGVLSLLIFLIFIPMVLYIDKLREDYILYLYFSGYVLGNAFIPRWFFQGVEKMQFLTLFVFISKLIFTAGVFILIREKADYYFYPLILSIAELSVAVISIRLAIKKFSIRLFIPKRIKLIYLLKESRTFFYASLSHSIFTQLNTLVIGNVLGDYTLGLYATAEKFYNAALTVVAPIKDVLYPYMARQQNLVLYKKIFGVVMLGTFLGTFILYQYSAEIIGLIAEDEFIGAAGYLSFFGFILLIQVPSMMIGYPLLAAVGKAKEANRSVIFATAIYLIALAFFYNRIQIETILAMLFVFHGFILIYQSVSAYKYFKEKKLSLTKAEF